jgi:hypothetical protein
MATTYVKIGSTVTVGAGGAATIDFTSIPATYTDLVILCSARGALTSAYVKVSFNGSTTGFTQKQVTGNGTAAASGSFAQLMFEVDRSTYTASTFSNSMAYIPNYAGANNKSYSADSVNENNATTAFTNLTAGLWSNTAAITSISLSIDSADLFVQYSTATLYGILKS